MSYRRLAVAVLAALCACHKSGPSIDNSMPKQKPIGFDVSFAAEIREPDGDLPYFELSQTELNAAFIEHLPKATQNAASSPDGFEFHPSFVDLSKQHTIVPESAPKLVELAISKMRAGFGHNESWFADDARVLYSARAHRGDSNAGDSYDPVESKLLYVSLRRSVEGRIVDGPGSRFTAAFSADATVFGAVYYWRTKKPAATLLSAPNSARVKDAIIAQLKHQRVVSPIVIRKVDIAYYDADQRFLQPVYRYVAEITHASAVSRGRTDFYVGYVPFMNQGGEVPEDLGNALDAKVTPPRYNTGLPDRATPDVFVGRYVSRGGSAAFQSDSEAFWNGLSTTPSAFRFKDAQHYPAWRWMFTSRKDWYANSVDLALVEAHGSPWTFLTFKDFGGDVRLDVDVPVSGYGSNGGGHLKHLILHSCRAIPTSADQYYGRVVTHWARDWWSLFNGLSSVVGYRSSMFIDDGASAAFARNIAQGTPVVPAWFGTVASLNIYGPDSWEMTYCADAEPMGRAAAITVCNLEPEKTPHEGANATVEHASTPRPTCLEAWWLGDELVPANASSPTNHPKVASIRPELCPDEGGANGPYPPYTN